MSENKPLISKRDQNQRQGEAEQRGYAVKIFQFAQIVKKYLSDRYQQKKQADPTQRTDARAEADREQDEA